MRLTLQQMVAGAIAEAAEREKIAQADPAPEKKEESAPPWASAEKKEDKKEAKKEEKKEEGEKQASVTTELVEKVASAVQYISEHPRAIEWPKVAAGEPLGAQPPNAPVPQVGASIGATATPTNMDSPTPGLQSANTGQATPQSQPPINPPKDDVGKKDGQTNPDTAMQTDMAHVPGGTGEQPQLQEKGNLSVDKVAAVRKVWAMRKEAANAESPAKISAGAEPLENPDGTAAEEKVPRQPSAFERQAKLIRSQDPAALANVTKQQAKAEPKRQMGEVLDEPAQKKSTDPVLHENLDAASSAGVKISSVQAKAARVYLEKLVQVGETGDGTPEEKEKAEKLKAALAKKKGEKEKSSQFDPSMAQPPPTTPMM